MCKYTFFLVWGNCLYIFGDFLLYFLSQELLLFGFGFFFSGTAFGHLNQEICENLKARFYFKIKQKGNLKYSTGDPVVAQRK